MQRRDTPPAELSRRERRKLEVRNRILEAAVELFESQGVDATTVLEIAERADVAEKTFFNHFPSRGDLMQEIVRAGIDNVVERIEEARKQPGSTADRVAAFFGGIAEFADDVGPMHRELTSEIIRAAQQSPHDGEPALRFHDAFGGLVADGLAAGDVDDRHDPETLTDMLLGAYYVLMLNWANVEGYPLHDRALAVARFLTDSMAAPASSGAGERQPR